MTPKSSSWKDIIAQRRGQNFVGRAEQIREFQANFAAEIPNYMVISVTGEGGVGKSTLLKRYTELAQGEDINANVVICDDRHLSPTIAMGYISDQLAKLGITDHDFNERYKKYQEVCNQIESDPKVPRSALTVMTRGLTDFTIKSLRRAPGVGPFMDYVDEKAAGDAVAELVQYSITRWGNKDEVQLVREPEKVLTPLFLNLLEQATEKKRLVLMFDVFERTKDMLTPWLLALFNFEYGDLNPRLTFIISGRDPLEQHWTELTGMLCHIRLEPFEREETKLYLSNRGITDEPLVNLIHKDTGGLPVLVELLTGTHPQPGMPLPDITKDAVERFLQWTADEKNRKAALLAAVPRQFNQDILSALLSEDAAGLFHWLSGQSYIRSTTERGWFYHEKVRELMLRYQKNTTPTALSELHLRLAQYFAGEQAKMELEIRDNYENEQWRRFELERVYHLFSVASEKNWPQVVNTFITAFYYRWRFAREIARLAQQVIFETAVKVLDKNVSILIDLVTANDRDDYQRVIQMLNTLQNSATLNDPAAKVFFGRRGEAHFFWGKFAEALADFDRAIELDQKFAWAIASRGQTYHSMSKYPEALADFDRAIKLDENNASMIASRGQTYRSMSKYPEALADFDRAIELDEKLAWAIARRGETYRLMGKFAEALANFDRAIELDQKYAWAIASRGQTYRLMDKYPEALADFDRAIELDENNASMIASRGDTYRLMGKFAEALADFDRAIKLDQKYAWAIASRGQTYHSMSKYPEALADFDRAIELDEKLDWAFRQRGITYRALKDYKKSLDDINHAIELKPASYSYYFSRAETYRQMGKCDEAIKDFTEAIKDNEPDIGTFTHRAVAYLALGNQEAAQQDLRLALSLECKEVDDHYDRGTALLLSERIPEALAELDFAFTDLANRILAQTDDLLDPLRELPEFKALMEKER
jgi:tetratricopeptide (TPR) repeat protein